MTVPLNSSHLSPEMMIDECPIITLMKLHLLFFSQLCCCVQLTEVDLFAVSK